MKVILLQDVAKLGRRFDVVEAPNGYAMNKLIPQRLAEPATTENLKRIEARQGKIETERAQGDTDFKAATEILSENPLAISASANEQEHLFKAIHEADIVAAAKELNVTITAEQVHIPNPIKSLGDHTVQLHFGDEKCDITVTITAA